MIRLTTKPYGNNFFSYSIKIIYYSVTSHEKFLELIEADTNWSFCFCEWNLVPKRTVATHENYKMSNWN